MDAHTDADTQALIDLNDRFIDACRQGSWEKLQQVLTPGFSYTNGNTGEVLDIEPYSKLVTPAPDLVIDQVVVHVDGDAGIVSARSSAMPGTYSRYVDSYRRVDGEWLCYHASVWRLQPTT